MSETATGTRPPTPFKELDFFTEDDAWMFAGRERETRQLVSRIVNARAIVVHARSGLGKTSLLRAGVIPLLRQQNFRPVYVRTLDSLLGDLAEAVVQDCQLPPPPAEGDPEARARHAIEAAAAGGPLVLVLDQFEEFFTRFERQPRERQAFVQFITGIVRDARRDVRVVFSLREDYLYALDEFQRKLPDLFAQAFRLLPLTPLGAREAIIRPLANEKVPYDEALITQLVDELTGFDFDSARLQVTCSEVYRHALAGANGSVALKAGDLNSLKESAGTGLRGIYKRYLREAVANIPAILQLETKLLLDKLISAKRTKFAIGREALHAELADTPRVDLVLTALCEQKLVRMETRGGKEWFELRHECLVDEILDWFKEDTTFDSFRFVRGLIEENSRGGRFRTRVEMLLTAEQLAAVDPLRDRLRLTPEQMEYVLRSAVLEHAPQFRSWARTAPPGVAGALLAELVRAPLPQMRHGALAAVALLEDADPPLTAACLAVAFDANEPKDMRLTARQSAAAKISDADLTALMAGARVLRTPPHLRDLLADLYEAGRMSRKWHFLHRWQAREEVARRRAQQFDDQRSSVITKAMLGAVGGGTLLILIVQFMIVLLHRRADSLEHMLTAVGYSVFLGALLGWRNGVAAFRVCTMGQTRWWKASAPFPPKNLRTLGAWIAFVLLAFLVKELGGPPVIALVAVWWILRAVVAGIVVAVEPRLRKVERTSRQLLWASALCVIPSIAYALLAKSLHLDDRTRESWSAVVNIPLYVLIADLYSFILAFPRGGIEGAVPVPPPMPDKLPRP